MKIPHAAVKTLFSQISKYSTTKRSRLKSCLCQCPWPWVTTELISNFLLYYVGIVVSCERDSWANQGFLVLVTFKLTLVKVGQCNRWKKKCNIWSRALPLVKEQRQDIIACTGQLLQFAYRMARLLERCEDKTSRGPWMTRHRICITLLMGIRKFSWQESDWSELYFKKNILVLKRIIGVWENSYQNSRECRPGVYSAGTSSSVVRCIIILCAIVN